MDDLYSIQHRKEKSNARCSDLRKRRDYRHRISGTGLNETRVLIQIKASKMRNYVKNQRYSIIALLVITLSNCSQGNNPFYYRLSPVVSDNGLPDRKRRSKIC